jgi:predicted MFS family arabinose efflux permease
MLIGVLAMFPTYRFLAALPWERLPPPKDRVTRPGRAERRRRTLTTLKIIVPYLFCGITVGLTAPFVNIFLKSVLGTSDHTVGFSLAAVSAFQCVLIVIIPLLVGRIGRVNLTAISLLLGAPLLFFTSWTSSTALSVLLLVAAIGFVQMSVPLQLSFAMRQYPSLQRGFVSSELAAVWYLANGIGAFLAVGVAENELAEIGRGYQPAAVFCLLSGITYWLFWRSSSKLPEDGCTTADHLACSHPSSGRLVPARLPVDEFGS